MKRRAFEKLKSNLKKEEALENTCDQSDFFNLDESTISENNFKEKSKENEEIVMSKMIIRSDNSDSFDYEDSMEYNTESKKSDYFFDQHFQ